MSQRSEFLGVPVEWCGRGGQARRATVKWVGSRAHLPGFDVSRRRNGFSSFEQELHFQHWITANTYLLASKRSDLADEALGLTVWRLFLRFYALHGLLHYAMFRVERPRTLATFVCLHFPWANAAVIVRHAAPRDMNADHVHCPAIVRHPVRFILEHTITICVSILIVAGHR